MKKRILLTLTAFVLILGVSKAQTIGVASKKKIELLKQSGISVIIPENKFGETLKKVVEKNWKATKFKFITEEEVAKFEDKKPIALLGYFKEQGKFEDARYTYTNLDFIGITEKYRTKKNYNVLKTVDCYVGMAYPTDGFLESDLEAKLTLYIKVLNKMVEMGGSKAYISQFKKRKLEVKNKVIYIAKDDMIVTKKEITAKYKGEIKILSSSEFNTRVVDNEDGIYLLQASTNVSFCNTLVGSDGFVYQGLSTGQANPKAKKSYFIYLFKYFK